MAKEKDDNTAFRQQLISRPCRASPRIPDHDDDTITFTAKLAIKKADAVLAIIAKETETQALPAGPAKETETQRAASK